MPRDAVTDQLQDYRNSGPPKKNLAVTNGRPIANGEDSQSVGKRGPLLLQDYTLIENLAHFDRERIPERVVHAKGSGAFGYFEVTTPEAAKYCRAKMFSEVGKRTPVGARFSTVGGQSGSPDTVPDPRGFALKFYTEEGNWDMVGNNTPVFFVKDAQLFTSFIHTQKKNPVTNLRDPDMFWDFLSLRPESLHQVSILMSPRGTPDGYRHMNGYGSHTFKNVNAKGEPVYVKYHFKTDQGIKNLPGKIAAHLAGADPDYSGRDLYNAIKKGNFPSWTVYIQVLTYKQAEEYPVNIFDVTKTISHKDFPLIEIGRLTLNRNPTNYFAEVEQIAFSPANLIPGIEPTPDKMFQARLFSYNDTQRHRLGANYEQIPVNRPIFAANNMINNTRDGPMRVDGNQGGAPNYQPNSFDNAVRDPSLQEHVDFATGDIKRYEDEEDNFSQVADFWNKALSEEDREVLVGNIATTLLDAAEFIQERQLKLFDQAHKEYGQRVRDMLAQVKKQVKEEGNGGSNDKVYDIKAAPLVPDRELPPKQ